MISKELSKPRSNSAKDHSEEKYRSFRKRFFVHFWTVIQNFSFFWEIFLRRVVTTAIYMSGGIFSTVYLFKNPLFFSLVIGIVKNLSAFCRKKPVRLPQLRFKWPQGSIEVIFLNRNIFLLGTSWHWLKKHQLFGKRFRGGCQNWILRV